jgi:hypothetical protein
VRRGLHAATTDPAEIKRWWTRWPEANVGIRTGRASGLLVLDIDGAAGEESLQALIGEHGLLSAAWVRTGSGGQHAYFALPADQTLPSSVGRLGRGLDIRAEGASIVAPPSRHASGDHYRWAAGATQPPPAPGWLIRLAQPDPIDAHISPLELRREVGRYAEAAIGREIDEVARAAPGTRNQRLNLAAWRLGQLVGGEMAGEALVAEALMAAAASAGLSPHESRLTRLD